MTEWKRIDDGLYQRFDDGKPQNVYIDRMGHISKSRKTFVVDAWMWGEKVRFVRAARLRPHPSPVSPTPAPPSPKGKALAKR